MKKLLILLLSSLLALLTACWSTDQKVENNSSDTSIEDSGRLPDSNQEIPESKDDEKDSNSNVIDTKIKMTEKLAFKDVSDLKTEILSDWSWDEVKNWDKVSVHYLWRFIDWSKFDSSVDRKQPFNFIIWNWQVIQGWEKWIVWMKVWELRRVHVPYAMWYWEAPRWPIPARSTLIFDVQLLKIN